MMRNTATPWIRQQIRSILEKRNGAYTFNLMRPKDVSSVIRNDDTYDGSRVRRNEASISSMTSVRRWFDALLRVFTGSIAAGYG